MLGGSIINGIVIVPSEFNKNNLLKNFGFNLSFLGKLEIRLEFFFKFNLYNYSSPQLVCLLKYLLLFVPIDKNFKKRRLVNIYFLDLIASYRGWRHSRGLPVRGQRTWTNSWSVFKSNLILREYRIEVSKKIYGSIQINHLSVAYLAEQINLLWKLQWEHEWRAAKKKRLLLLQNENAVQKIDLLSMSKGLVGKYTKDGKKKTKKKTKKTKLCFIRFWPWFY